MALFFAPHPRHRLARCSTGPKSRSASDCCRFSTGKLADGLEVRRALVLRGKIGVRGGVAGEGHAQHRREDGRRARLQMEQGHQRQREGVEAPGHGVVAVEMLGPHLHQGTRGRGIASPGSPSSPAPRSCTRRRFRRTRRSSPRLGSYSLIRGTRACATRFTSANARYLSSTQPCSAAAPLLLYPRGGCCLRLRPRPLAPASLPISFGSYHGTWGIPRARCRCRTPAVWNTETYEPNGALGPRQETCLQHMSRRRSRFCRF